MSAREFAEWMAYDRIDPFGSERADWRSASIAALLANIYRDDKQRSKPFEVNDFMPKFDAPPSDEPVEAWRAQKAAFMALKNISKPKARKK